GKYLVQPVLANEFARRRQAHVRLQLLLAERRRWMGEAVVNEFLGRTVDLLARRYCGLFIVLRDEASLDVARADAQLHHHRGVRGFGELEAALDHLDDRRQVRTRVEQPHQRLEREGVAALLRDHAALAV